MNRGEIWSAAARGDLEAESRPVVIVQDDDFSATAQVTICALTRDATEAPLFRLEVEPDLVNGLEHASRLMVDKLTTVPRTSIGARIGRLSAEDLVRLDRAIVVFLGIG